MGDEDEEEVIFDDQVFRGRKGNFRHKNFGPKNQRANCVDHQGFFSSNLAQSGVSCPDCGEIPDIYGNFGHKTCSSIKFSSIQIVIYTNQAETAFDQIVGAIEDIVIDDRFQDLQTDLLEKHFHHFDVSTSAKTKKKTEFKTPKLIC